MKEHAPSQITKEEISVASRQKVIDSGAISAFISQAESANEDIRRALERQAQVTAVSEQHGLVSKFSDVDILKGPWDQETFEDLLAKWIIATDQPFYTVDEPKFRKLLAYAHHRSPELKIPHRNAVKNQVMKMGEDTIDATKELFAVCNLNCISKVVLPVTTERRRRQNQHFTRHVDIKQ